MTDSQPGEVGLAEVELRPSTHQRFEQVAVPGSPAFFLLFLRRVRHACVIPNLGMVRIWQNGESPLINSEKKEEKTLPPNQNSPPHISAPRSGGIARMMRHITVNTTLRQPPPAPHHRQHNTSVDGDVVQVEW